MFLLGDNLHKFYLFADINTIQANTDLPEKNYNFQNLSKYHKKPKF